MHLPDAFLSAKTAAGAAVLASAGVALALWQARLHVPPRRVPLMGLSAAFIFAAQMLNFPVGAGVSGHLIGGVLAAVLLGPSPAVVVMTAVLIVQCLLFSDGGITALGANVFNMGLLNTVGGYGIYYLVCRCLGVVGQPSRLSTSVTSQRLILPGLRERIVAAAFAAWCGTVLAAIACAGELALSGKLRWSVAFPAMTLVHMVIGLGEGLITALVLLAVARARPELLDDAEAEHSLVVRPLCRLPAPTGLKPVLQTKNGPKPGLQTAGIAIAYGLILSLGLAAFVAPFACRWDDGLDSVAHRGGLEQGQTFFAGPIAGYKLPVFGSTALATSVAGAVGTVVVFGLALILVRMLVPVEMRKDGQDATDDPPKP